MNIEAVDRVVYSPHWKPRRGWHDDHRKNDRTLDYLPAMQQVRAEFAGLIDVLREKKLLGGSCLQLGMGECEASHAAWRALFWLVVTVDLGVCAVNEDRRPGLNTHSPEGVAFAAQHAPYDLVFIDAGHLYEDVQEDFQRYGPFAKKPGVIAFHDAAKREGYADEVHVWRFLEQLRVIYRWDVQMIGDEVGIAWVERR